MTSLVVFSHLRWNFVFQRPQHVLSRMASRYPVIFIEEPVADTTAWLEESSPADNVRVLIPHLPGADNSGFSGAGLAGVRRLLEKFLLGEHIGEHVVWFYTPMAVPLLDLFAPRATVFDCMDELSAFENAPPELVERERDLLRAADVVFTGGRSLYEAKRHHHANVHCFPSSVDREHFAQGRNASLEHPGLRELVRPRLGFFGVLDERLDIPLLDRVAAERPGWALVLVGPVVKIDPGALPRRPNISYFGQQDYADLPRFLAGWDICILPFALNRATRFISPTKTLEYMAAERPIVSTPITDVAGQYAGTVAIAGDAGEFVARCEALLGEDTARRAARAAAMRDIVAATSWDRTVRAMAQLLEASIHGRRHAARPQPVQPAGEPVNGRGTAEHHRTVIIGAGPTGLSAAYHLDGDTLLLEQNERVGGWCRSITDNGFTFDCAGHIMFSNDEYVQTLYRRLLGDNVHWQDREAWIYSKGVHTRYPFQGALYGLPPAVLRECLVGAIEARFGPLRPAAAKADGANPAPCSSRSREKVTPMLDREAAAREFEDCCGDGVLELPRATSASPGRADAGPPANFEEFIYRTWGRGVAKHFAIPYNRKLWAVPLDQIETSWLGGRVPLPDLEEMIEGALEPVAKPQGPNARFGYPLEGGFQALMDGFLPHIRGRIELDTRVARVSPHQRTVTCADGTLRHYDVLISTMPLPKLVAIMGEEAPPEIQRAAQELRHVSVRCVNLGIGRPALTEKHWIYYPEDPVFHRIFVQGNASPACNPPGGFGLTCEITYSPDKPLPCEGDALIRRCIDDCIRVGLFRPDDPVWAANQVDLPYAYVVYDHDRARHVQRIRDWLARHSILLAGRYSEWEYYNSDHAFLAGRKAAETASALLQAAGARARAVRHRPAAQVTPVTGASAVAYRRSSGDVTGRSAL